MFGEENSLSKSWMTDDTVRISEVTTDPRLTKDVDGEIELTPPR
jgi:hypothetical protein